MIHELYTLFFILTYIRRIIEPQLRGIRMEGNNCPKTKAMSYINILYTI